MCYHRTCLFVAYIWFAVGCLRRAWRDVCTHDLPVAHDCIIPRLVTASADAKIIKLFVVSYEICRWPAGTPGECYHAVVIAESPKTGTSRASLATKSRGNERSHCEIAS